MSSSSRAPEPRTSLHGDERVVIGASPCNRRIVFRLEPAGETGGPALAHGHGFALTHLQRAHTDAERRLIARVAEMWRSPEGAMFGAEQARVELRSMLCEAGDPACVEPGTVLPALTRVELWTHVRDGLRELRDARPEVVGLRAGLRTLLKWEADAQSTRRLRETLEAEGFHAAEGPGETLFVSSRRDQLTEALEAEAKLRDPTQEDDASRWIGEALGYPSCCVSAYLEQTSRDDVSLALAVLPLGVPGLDPAPPETTWIHGGVSLVSHVPCSPWCARTAEQASRLAAAYDSQHAGFSARWRAAARAIHVLDDRGAALSVGPSPDAAGWEWRSGVDRWPTRRPPAPGCWASAPSPPTGRSAALWTDHRG